jgi:hypothetical protein
LRFPAIEVVLACFGPRRASRVSQDLDRCRIVAASPPNTGVLLVEFDLAARSAPARTSSSPIAALLSPPPSSPIAALLSLLSPPPMSRRCNRPRDLAAMCGLSMKRRAPGADTPEMKRCHGGHSECTFRVME